MNSLSDENLNGLKYLIVGAGLYGSVVAERIASQLNEQVLVIDERVHSGGNVHAYIDQKTGIEAHTYGSHIFHTKNQSVWDYVTRFTSFNNYRHRVFTMHKGEVYPMPIGLQTINQFFRKTLRPFEVQDFINQQIDHERCADPKNLEEKAISLIGEPLYRAFIEGYTKKQWGKSPLDLPASIITRLPVRYSYNSDYFTDPYQGIPSDGYQVLFDNLLSHDKISVRLGISYHEIKNLIPSDCRVIYTGMPDQFFNYKYGELDWRSLKFEWEEQPAVDYQGNSVMNYADEDVSYTRIHEFKHYHTEWDQSFNSNKTLLCKEYPDNYTRGKEAFYPVNDPTNSERYRLYAQEAANHSNLILGGRLGAYQYWDMDKAIENALLCFDQIKLSHT